MRLFLALCFAASLHAQLRIYAIDVEGGKSTLFVSPSGKSMLVDAGYDGNNSRDAKRIAAAAKDAGISRIDYLVITHYHHDHVGGVPQLAPMLPIGTFVDHGKNFETVKDNGAVYSAYVKQRDRHAHIEVRAGDIIPIEGIQVQVVTASGKAIERPLPSAGQLNPVCKTYHSIKPDSGENAHSIGMVITYGSFRAADLGDLYWNQEFDLACPANKVGTVDLYLSTHHGKKTSGSPQMVHALGARAAIVNNGPSTGAAEEAWQTIHDSPGMLDLWQLHYAGANDKNHNAPEPYIANLKDSCSGDWIKVTAQANGTFAVVNGRNGFAKTYSK